MVNITRCVCALLLLAVSAIPQRPGRVLVSLGACDHGSYMASRVGEVVSWTFACSESGELVALGPDVTSPDAATMAELVVDPFFVGVTLSSETPVDRSAQSQITFPGGFCAAEPGLHLLLGGRGSTGSGRLEYWSIDPISNALVMVSGQDYPGRDWIGVGVDHVNFVLYLLDGVSGDLLTGSWNRSTPTLPTSLQVFATSGSYAGIGPIGDLSLRYVADGSGQVPNGGAVFVYDKLDVFGPGVFLVNQGGSVVASTGRWVAAFAGGGPKVVAESAAEGGSSVMVIGCEGHIVTVTNLRDGSVVGSGLIPSGSGGMVTVVCSPPFTIGNVYQVRYATSNPLFPSSFECVARYGQPEATSLGLTFAKRRGEPDARVGNNHFRVVVDVTMAPPPGTGTVIAGVWTLGAFRDANGGDPIIPNPFGGNGPVLLPVAMLPAVGYVYGGGDGQLDLGLPIGANPVLIGEILLTQFAVLDPGQPAFLKFSEVIGFPIRAQ